MQKFKATQILLVFAIMFMLVSSAFAQKVPSEKDREVQAGDIYFSTEEDFITEEGIISGGDLLNSAGFVYMRNYELLRVFQMNYDLGLDAADVIDAKSRLVAFSTELDGWEFTDGDLLVTNGAILPNKALLVAFNIPLDLGLDAVHFTGQQDDIIAFLDLAKEYSRDYWLRYPWSLVLNLLRYKIDICFSTESKAPPVDNPRFLNGDLLSAATGTIVLKNEDAVPVATLARLPDRVDFGLDAVSMWLIFSSEIDNLMSPIFTDGDVLWSDGVLFYNADLINSFKAKVNELGLDALSSRTESFWLSPPKKKPLKSQPK